MFKPALFIDFDGTICFDHFWRSSDPALREKINKYLFQSNPHLIEEWMLGKCTSEDINRLLSNEIATPYKPLWELFVRDCKEMTVAPEALEAIAATRDRFTTVLITDNMDSFNRFTVPSLGLEAYFDVIANSCDYGVTKEDTEGAFFNRVCSSHGLHLTGSHLIDNSSLNCDIFDVLGGVSHLVSPDYTIKEVLSVIDLHRPSDIQPYGANSDSGNRRWRGIRQVNAA